MFKTFKKLVTTAPLVYPRPGFQARFHRMKYCVRGLTHARCSQEWFDLLALPELAAVTRHHPYVFCKLQRPYLNRHLDVGQRLATLKQHYSFVAKQFSQSGMESIYADPGLLLAVLPVKDVGNFGVQLSYGRQEKEGDLIVQLVNLDKDKRLFELSFCISKFDPQPRELFIGGLQGNRRNHDKDLIIAITRAMHGLRPKALLVFVLQQLAVCWKIAKIRAVSDDTHIYRHPHKLKELVTSYNEFWIDCDGTTGSEGMFELPAVFAAREISSIRANKRQMYRHRYVMLAEIARQIKDAWRQVSLETNSNPNVFQVVVPPSSPASEASLIEPSK
jgi:uncharacterized protein VirK/YbjX